MARRRLRRVFKRKSRRGKGMRKYRKYRKFKMTRPMRRLRNKIENSRERKFVITSSDILDAVNPPYMTVPGVG